MTDQKCVIPGPKARYSLFFSDLTLFSVAPFSAGAMRGPPAQSDLGRKPPETSPQLHLRGLCYERGGIGSFACKSLLGAM